ncbi:MAG: conjugative relaxase, partial [Proteobacteria bacterium]|nr:conjugative relaxase [Pseudomonadota bacterium]
MSIGIVKSGADVHKYFTDKDNYYLTDKSELKEAATWYGKGAESLGIKGEQVDEKLFLDLLEGRMPDGSQIGIMKDGSIKHRPATDITFSAPKSVSLMALVAGDTRLVEAHNHAVKTALDKIESMYAEARYTENRITTYEKTNNLTIATFRHTTSRELDAQLHTHGVVINATQREDGQWRALSSRHKADTENLEHGFRENLYANQHYLGMIYTSELAKAVKESGYDIRIKDKHGNFEIVGLSQEYIDSQSKRRQQVLFALQEKGLSGAKAAQVATLNSRGIKQETELDVIREYWIKDAKKQEVQLGEVYLNSLKNLDAKTQGNTQTSDAMPAFSQNAKEAINDSLAHLSQYDVQIRHGDIIRQAFIFGAGAIDHEQLESVLSDKIKSGEIIGKADYYYTTKALIDTEKRLTDKFEQSKGAGFSVDTKQSGLVANVLKHNDRLQVIDVKGFKNEDKLLDSLVKASEANGLNTYVVHQNQSRLNRLDGQVERDNSSFWKAISNHFKHDLMTTTGKFLHDYENKLNQGLFFSNFGRDKQDLVIITDAQKLSYQDGEQIEALTRAGKAKVVFLNNTESTKGFQAGNFVKLLKDSGIENHKSTTAKKDTLVNVAASKDIYQDLAKAFVAHNYDLSNPNKSIDSKSNTVIAVTYTNKSQVEATRHIRDELQKQGALSLQEIAFDTVSTKGLSDIEKTKLKCYQIGDLVTLKSKEGSSKNSNNKLFQSYFVTGFDKDNNQLLLKKVVDFKAQHNESGILQSFVASIGHNGNKQSGDVFAFNPTNTNTAKGEDGKAVDFEVRKKQTLNISVGEQLSTTRNLYLDAKDQIKRSQSSSIFAKVDSQTTKIEKNSTFTVTAIHQDNVTIAHGNKQFSLSKDKLKQSFVDYGYVVKPHQLTKDIDHVLTGLSGYQVNQNSIGEVAEYAKKVTLFTDNPDKSIKALDKESINWI